MMIALPNLIYSLGLALVSFAVIFLLGNPFCQRLQNYSLPITGCIALTVGLGLFSYVCVFMSYFGLFSPTATIVAFAVFTVIGFRKLSVLRLWGRMTFKEMTMNDRSLFGWALQIVWWGSFALTLLMCLLPEIANDALAHHLNMAKRFTHAGLIAPIQYDIKSYQSLLMNGVYAFALLHDSVILAKLFHWASGILLTVCLIRVIEEETDNRSLSFFLGVMLWLTPTLMNQVTTTYVDVAATLFLFLSVWLFLHSREEMNGLASAMIGGILLGFSMVTKLSVFLALPPLVCIGVYRLWKAKDRQGYFRILLLFAAGFLIASVFFLLRNVLLTGDPLYPMLTPLEGEDFKEALYRLGPKKTVLSFLLLPLNLTFRPWDYDYHHWAGPFYLCALPFAVYGAVKNKQARDLMFFVFVYTIGWYWMGQNVRYLLPAFPLYLIAAAYGFQAVYPKWGAILRIGGFGLLAGLSALTVYHFRWQIQAVMSGWTQEKYLERMERSFPLAAWINQNLPDDSKILALREVRLFYFDPPIVRRGMLEQTEGTLAEWEPQEIADFLQAEGFTHILDSHRTGKNPADPGPIPKDPVILQLEKAGALKPVIEMTSKNVKESRYAYILYSITPSAA